MNPVVHFEMGYRDRDRAKEFYSKTFGWQMNQMGEDMPARPDDSGHSGGGQYVVVQTGETEGGATGRPTKPGYINGGLYQKQGPDSEAPSIVIAVPDIHKAVEDVKANGGKILGGMNPDGTHTMEPTMIPGVGLWISIQDTEGNRVSMLQSLGM